MSDQNKRNEEEPQVPPVVDEDPGVEEISVGGLGAGLTNSRREPAATNEGEPGAEGDDPDANAAPDDASAREAEAKIRDSARETGEKVGEAAEAEAAAEENQAEQPMTARQRRFKDAFGAVLPDDELSDLMDPRRNIRGQEYIKYGDNAQMTRNHDGSISLKAKANAVETRMAVKHSLEIMRQQGFTSLQLTAKKGSRLGNMQWLEARKMGFEVEGFTPSPEAKQAYLDHRAALDREAAANQAPNDPTPPPPPPADAAPAADAPDAKAPDNKGPDGNGPDGNGPDGNAPSGNTPQGPAGNEPAAADAKPTDGKAADTKASESDRKSVV